MRRKPKVAIISKRPRGRPRNIKRAKPNSFRLEFEQIHTEILSELISERLEIATSNFTYEIAHVALAYLPLRELYRHAPMKPGCTNRPKNHRDVLMRDIACVYARYAHTSPDAELKKINFSREQRAANKLSRRIESKQPPVEAATRVVLEVVGEKYLGSLRRTAMGARRLLKTDLLL